MQAAVAACEMAASSAALTGQEIDLALDALRGGVAGQPGLRQRLENMAARFDDEYLQLWEESDEEHDESKKLEALRLFSKTCAASALAFALSGDPAQLHEAIYEAIEALDDPSELVRAVQNKLR